MFELRYKEEKKMQLEEWSVATLNREVTSSISLRGHVIVITFWATWCPPALREIPGFIELQSKYDNMKVTFLGIVVDDQESSIKKKIEELGINYKICQNNGLEKILGLNIPVLVPTTVVINRNGELVFKKNGGIKKDEIEA